MIARQSDKQKSAEVRTNVTMRDVADAAGVSTTTVSNVLNHPHVVAVQTRERVRRVIQELEFRPDPNARALRKFQRIMKDDPVSDSTSASSEQPTSVPDPAVTAPDPAPASSRSERIFDDLVPGRHITFEIGCERASGIIDSVMADKSCFWVWTDNGMGRRIVDSYEATAFAASAQ